MVNGACCLDVARDRREASASVAKLIVRKRLLNAGQGVDRCSEDGTNIVFRKPGIPYINCIFLDEHDTVLVGDQRGYMDIVRLPRYDGSSNEPRRPLGQALCTNLSAATDGGKVEPYCKLHSLQNGKAFAVGLASGEMRVFATEHASLLDALPLGLQPTSVSQITPNNFYKSYVTQGFKTTRPLRRYQRNFATSLSHLLQHPTGHSSRLREIYNWDNPLFFGGAEGFVAHHHQQSQWDFRETPSGTLQAVHIGQQCDMFGLRVLDDRTPRSQNDICVDLDMQNESDMTAVCFVSDNSVATSVSWDSDANIQHCEIKLWDIRMIKNGEACTNTVLPSYPRDVAHGMRAKESLLIREDGAQNRTWLSKSGASAPLKAPSPLIYDLARLHDRHLMATAQFDHHFVVDPFKGAVVATVTGPCPELRSPDCTRLSPYAVDRQHGTVAIYEGGPGDTKTIALHTVNGDNGRVGRKRKLPGPTSKLETLIQDCYGLTTNLSCLAFNPSGTSLVGASVDGDLFAWRAA